ncbi:hypothetical protein [Salinicoccus sp. RF5]|uniref:hypothetical protein n=1 Tax=Salinicoccus sp. RF5 TaxID=2748874 RepID=UPI001E63A303|nr:hypothetical protein [Salinicoccus sp. RF5]MCC4722294.1 hypothetical protein [Salinicoccus sp. RF5]
MKRFIKKLKRPKSVSIKWNKHIGKAGLALKKARGSAAAFIQRRREQRRIRETARHQYYWQFTNAQLQEMHDRTDSMRTQGAIKRLMKQRGYKYDFEVDLFVPDDASKVEKSGKVHLLENRKIRSYEEIESQLRAREEEKG